MLEVVSEQSGRVAAAVALLKSEGFEVKSRAERKVGYMRIWDDRQAEVMSVLAARRDGVANDALWLLPHVLNALPRDGQRVPVDQSRLGGAAGLDPARTSRAFALLREAGVVLAPMPLGRSQSWEVDARYASKQPDAAVHREIDRQRVALEAERVVRSRLRVVASVPLREVAYDPPA